MDATSKISRRYGKLYELRTVIGVPPGHAGIGINIGHDQLSFAFAAHQQVVELSLRQLQPVAKK